MDEEEKKEVIEDVVEEDDEEEKEEPDPEPEEQPEPEPAAAPEAPAIDDSEVIRKLDSIIEAVGLVSKAIAQMGISSGADLTQDVKAEVTEDTSAAIPLEEMDFSMDTKGNYDDTLEENYVD